MLLAAVGAALPSAAAAQAPCSHEVAPGGSVQNLVDQLDPGEVGCLRAGVHVESVTMRRGGVPGQPVTLRAFPGEAVTLVGRLVLANTADHVIVEQLTLDGRNPGRLPSPTINSSNVIFRHNDVTNHHAGICFVIGASNIDNDSRYGRAENVVIQRNRIHDCGRIPSTNHDHGVYVEGADRTYIHGNWIYDNADRGVQLYPDAQHSLVEGNVIDGNGSGVIFSGEGETTSNDNVVRGNVITGARVRHNVESWWAGAVGQRNLLVGNCLWGGRGNAGLSLSDGGFTARDNMVAQPRYLNRGAADFRLAPDSPCRETFAEADAIPGPGGTPADLIPERPRSSRRRPALHLKVHSRAAGNRIVRLVGRVNLRRVPAGHRVRIVAHARRRAVVARPRVRRNGVFRARCKVRTRARIVKLVATVPGVARSRPVRLRLRR